MTAPAQPGRISTGIDGLDEILHGGLIPERGYMITGEPGTGKTILGLHYLTAGIAEGDETLYVNLEEASDDIRQNAASLGFDVDPITFLDLSPEADVFGEGSTYEVFAPDEVEGSDVTERINDRITSVDPDRVFVDPVTHLRYLTPDDYQFRKQITGLIRLLKEQGATVLFTSQSTAASPDDDLQFLSDGTIRTSHDEDGGWIAVPKFRGSDIESGSHTLRITDHGIEVYPQLVPRAHHREFEEGQVSSGVPEIDELLNGGFERGTVSIISGATGVGKTTLGSQFMKEAAGRGERSVIYMFEENRRTFLDRCEGVNIPAETMVDRGTLKIEEVEALRRSPDEFASMVRQEVEDEGASIVMIDGIDGYQLSIRGDETDLVRELQALSRYLKNMGVTVILVDTVESLTGEFRPTRGGISYLADNIVFLRYLEMRAELRKAIGVLKKRTSDFERSLREFELSENGLKVGEPLRELRGVLSGAPEFVDAPRRDQEGQ